MSVYTLDGLLVGTVDHNERDPIRDPEKVINCARDTVGEVGLDGKIYAKFPAMIGRVNKYGLISTVKGRLVGDVSDIGMVTKADRIVGKIIVEHGVPRIQVMGAAALLLVLDKA